MPCLKTDLSIVYFASAKKRIQRIISRNNKTCKIDEKFTANIEKYEKEVTSDKAEKDINFRN